MTDARWLKPEQAAAYIGRRVDELNRLQRAGKLPKPSLHFGPRSPRYDRLELDALFTGKTASIDLDKAEEAACRAIIDRAGRQAAVGGRNGQGISLPSPPPPPASESRTRNR